MPKILTEQQIQDYKQYGFISPVDVMPETEAEQFRLKLEQAELQLSLIHI